MGRIVSWHLDFCRRLRTFEEESFNGLLTLLGEFPLMPTKDDVMIWSGDSLGRILVKAIVNSAQSQLSNGENITKSIWEGLPHQESKFLFGVLKEKILTREELKRKGLLRNEDDLKCIFCELLHEDVNHHFVNCVVAKGLWTKFINFFGIHWVFETSCVETIGAWNLLRLKPKLKIAWQTILAIILWTLWKEKKCKNLQRNIFWWKRPLPNCQVEMVCLDVGWSQFQGSQNQRSHLILGGFYTCMSDYRRKVKPTEKWCPPQ